MTGSDPLARQQDAAARALAQTEFRRPVVVEAGAGTGKTATLVARIVAWTLGPGWDRARRDLAGAGTRPPTGDQVAQATMRGVVAITFTDAAAAEMAERVGQALLDLCRDQVPTGVLADRLPADPEQRQDRARALLGALDLLEVRTIHAFCARLLQHHALAAGLHPAFTVDADGSAREAAVHEVVTQALVAGLQDPPDDDLLALAVQGVGPEDIAAAVTAFLEAAVHPDDLAGDPLAGPAVQALVGDLVAALSALAAATAGLAASKLKTNLARLSRALPELVAALGPAPGLEPARDVVLALSEAHASALASLRRGSLGVSELKVIDDPGAVEAAGRQVGRLVAFLAELDPEACRRGLRVVGPLVARARQRLRQQGALGFGELLVEAAALLRDRAEVRQRLRSGLQQLLVDEFQDTDPRQCEIVAALALDGDPDQRPGLFIVGDPKQSIYGWRRADLRAYQGFVDRVLQDGGQAVSLVVNFRSVPAVLDAVEGAVGPVMVPQAGRQPPFQRLEPCDRLADQPGFQGRDGQAPVELWATWLWQETDGGRLPADKQLKPAVRASEARAVARDIARLGAQGVAWRQVAVLFRSSTDLPVLVQALREAGVPYAVERDRSYFLRREVADAAALVAVVTAPHDQVALVSWLRSAPVGVPDAALLPLWREQLPDRLAALDGPSPQALVELDGIVDRAHRAVRSLDPQPPGLERVAGWPHALRDALHRLALLRAARDSEPVDRFVAALRELGGLELAEAARYQGPWRLANLDRLFRGLLAGLADGGDVHAVLRHLREGLAGQREAEEGRPQEAAEDAVQLMTIHKSKGLGFDHVYLVAADKQAGKVGAPRTEVQDAAAWRLFGVPAPGLLAHQLEAEAVARAEQVRLLYVALTRAKQRLVVTGCWDPEPTGLDPDQASSTVQLLGRWAAVPGDLGQRAVALPPDQEGWSQGGVRWVVPGRWQEVVASPGAAGSAGPPAPHLVPAERARADQQDLVRARSRARARMARPWTRGPSAHDPDRLAATLESAAEDAARPVGLGAPAERARRLGKQVGPDGAMPLDGQRVAQAAGTAVHLVLERLDLDHPDGPAALAKAALDLEDRLALAHPAPVAAAAAERARALLDGLVGGQLLGRLQALGAQGVVARELAVLLPPPASEGPVGAIVGAIDLVYRDPVDGGLVVADYKTDQVVGAGALAERTRAYAPQVQLYARALQEALDLPEPPRAELWFLAADQVAVV